MGRNIDSKYYSKVEGEKGKGNSNDQGMDLGNY